MRELIVVLFANGCRFAFDDLTGGSRRSGDGFGAGTEATTETLYIKSLFFRCVVTKHIKKIERAPKLSKAKTMNGVSSKSGIW